MTWPVTPDPGIHDDTTAVKQQNFFTPAQLLKWAEQLPLSMIWDLCATIITALGGTPTSTPPDTLAELLVDVLSAFDNVPLIGPLIAALSGSTGNSVPTIADLAHTISSLFRSVSVGALSNTQPNLLPAPTFPAGSIATNPQWTVDLGVSSDGTGCADIILDGAFAALRSGRFPADTITVGSGQTLNLSVNVCYDSYSGVGDAPILLQIVPFTASGAGAPVTLQTYTPTADDLAWPGDQITGTYTVPSGVTGAQMRIYVTDNALSGTLHFDSASLTQSATAPLSFITGLEQFITTVPAALQANIQAIIDQVVQTFTGSTTVQNTLTDLIFALSNILPGNVSGVLGPGTIEETVSQVLDTLVGSAGSGFGELATFIGLLSSQANLGSEASTTLGIRDNTPVASGLLPSSTSNFNLTDVAFTSTAPVIAVTQAASTIATIRIPAAAPLGVISWLGYGDTNITGFYINVWNIDPTTGGWALLQQSSNLIGDLVGGTTPQYMFWTLATPIASTASQQLAVEFVPVGSGTHYIIGQTTGSWLPAHPTAAVAAYGYTRNNTSSPTSPPSTITKGSLTAADPVPWIEMAINNGTTGADIYNPVVVYCNTSGSVPIPAFAGYVDVVVVGAGGNGAPGVIGSYGNPGTPGAFNTTTWVSGTHFTGTSTVVDFSGSSVSIPGYTVTAVDGSNGEGTRPAIGPGPIGKGPGPLSYNGMPADGGGDQNVYGGNGAAPGGAGNGGQWFGIYSPGGQGAPSAAWLQFRQGALSGEGSPGTGTGNVTAPDAPTLSVVGVTPLSVTVTTASGYPAPTVDLDGVTSPRSFGSMTVVLWGPPGEQFPYTFPAELS